MMVIFFGGEQRLPGVNSPRLCGRVGGVKSCNGGVSAGVSKTCHGVVSAALRAWRWGVGAQNGLWGYKFCYSNDFIVDFHHFFIVFGIKRR